MQVSSVSPAGNQLRVQSTGMGCQPYLQQDPNHFLLEEAERGPWLFARQPLKAGKELQKDATLQTSWIAEQKSCLVTESCLWFSACQRLSKSSLRPPHLLVSSLYLLATALAPHIC